MRLRSAWWCVLLSCLVFIGQVSVAQVAANPPSVPESEAFEHLLEHNPPVYPPIAQAARIQGEVVLAVVIDATGHVTSVLAVSGSSMLRQSAVDAVRAWQFTPFQINGQAAEVTTTLTIPYYLTHPTAVQQKAAQAWLSLSDQCRSSLMANNNPQDAVERCKQALDMSLQAGDLTSRDRLASLISYKDYGDALLADKQPKPALAAENRAVGLARANLHNTDEAYAMPFYWRAMAEISLEKRDKASADLTIAEISLRSMIVQRSERKDVYSRSLASMLKQHAELLDQMGKSANAEKLRTEAASLGN